MILDDHHYLFHLRAACEAQPELNAHQLAALDDAMAKACSAESIEQFMWETADLLEVSRAASLDRAANLIASSTRIDDPWLAGAATIEYHHALTGKNHAELYASLRKGKTKSAGLRSISSEVQGAIGRLFWLLLHRHTATGEPDEGGEEVTSCIQLLDEYDPAFRPRAWLSQSRYRWRIPWSSSVVHTWLDPLWPRQSKSVAALPESEIRYAREKWFEGLKGYEGQWPEVGDDLRTTTLPLEPCYLQRQARWPDPVLLRHLQHTSSQLKNAKSAIAQEAVSVEGSMRFQLEATWNRLLLCSILAPFEASAKQLVTGVDAHLAKAARTSYELTGRGPRALLKLPFMNRFFKENIGWNADSTATEGLGSFDGEAGFQLLNWVRQGGKDFTKALPDGDFPEHCWPILHWGVAESLEGYGL